jgi:glucose dehydrogenase
VDVAGPRLAGIWLGAVFGLCMLLKETFLACVGGCGNFLACVYMVGAIYWLVYVIGTNFWPVECVESHTLSCNIDTEHPQEHFT